MWNRVKETAAKEMNLPKDVVLGEALVTLLGKREVLIENYRGILIYEEAQIKLQTKNGKLTIRGKRLHIEYYTQEEMKVTGQIQSVEFGD